MTIEVICYYMKGDRTDCSDYWRT